MNSAVVFADYFISAKCAFEKFRFHAVIILRRFAMSKPTRQLSFAVAVAFDLYLQFVIY